MATESHCFHLAATIQQGFGAIQAVNEPGSTAVVVAAVGTAG